MPHNDPNGISDNEDEIQSNTTTKKSKKEKKPRDPLKSAASTIARCVDFSCDTDFVIKTVQLIQQDDASKHGELDEDETERQVREQTLSKIPPDLREQMVQTYYKLLQLIPGLKAAIEDPTKGNELASICTKVNTYIKGTRSTDSSHLRSHIASYVIPPNKPHLFDPPILISSDRSELGLNHPILARWICPAEKLEEFDRDPVQARKDMASGKIALVADDFPSFFWSGEMPGDDFNPERMFDGLFRSYFLARVGRHVFSGPIHAIQHDPRRGRSNNATLNGMTTVEAPQIAYLSIIARYVISSMPSWNETDGPLNYVALYRNIVSFIRSASEEWRNDLYRWWNKELFQNENGRQGTSSSTTTNSAPRVSMMERMRAQMQAHDTAKSQPAINSAIEAPASSTQGPATDNTSLAMEPTSSAQVPVIPHSPASTSSAQAPLIPVPSAQAPVIIDPRLAASTALSTQAPLAVPSTSRPQVPVMGPSTTERIGATVTNGIHAFSTSGPSSTPTPHRALDIPHSPLTDEEELRNLPLTPVTNKKMTIPTAKGKKRARVADQVEAGAEGSRPKRAKRGRK